MAHLWRPAEDGSLTPLALDGDRFTVDRDGCVRADPGAPDAEDDRAILRRSGDAWVLLSPSALRVLVNGMPTPTGIVVLADRDEVRVQDSAPCYFSTERLAAVERFPGTEGGGSCPRCKQTITPGAPAVGCPGCDIYYHQDERLPCWTYADRCAVCGRPTPLDAGFTWTPEVL